MGSWQRAERLDFVEFVQQRSAALFRTAYVLTGHQQVAEDLVQEALEKACRRWRRIAATDSPEAYVRRILVNLANDRWRRAKRAGERFEVPERADPHDSYRQVELRDGLVRALHALPIGMRTVVVLHYLHDQGPDEIAETLGITASSVRSQLSRGIGKLRMSEINFPQFEGA
ncbi:MULTISPECIES: SigE family RNA polymerase sigma factor [Kitasatospora]|uniref:SigE family RNA polymerase sigma factor n=1 Tax=Kitasatospora TaxID=2063 RepID=UPI000C70A03D|nr:SigE family RNA polymerase sigma factor [Kitasatospora sp. GP30]MDH6141301.1 RNA polymerase sigma-70 factor (sigma-E family) [Kitasatospora sp. GP30]